MCEAFQPARACWQTILSPSSRGDAVSQRPVRLAGVERDFIAGLEPSDKVPSPAPTSAPRSATFLP